MKKKNNLKLLLKILSIKKRYSALLDLDYLLFCLKSRPIKEIRILKKEKEKSFLLLPDNILEKLRLLLFAKVK
jgi:hypothetical protein